MRGAFCILDKLRKAWYNTNKEQEQWITLKNGVHILLKPGQSKADAIKKFTDEQERKNSLKEKSEDDLKKDATQKADSPKKRRTAHKSELTADSKTYVFPTDVSIKLGTKEFMFTKPIVTTDTITIVKPNQLREQKRIFQSYGGNHGQWSKKAGNAMVELSGSLQARQIHWYENFDGTVAGIKIKKFKE